MNRRPRAVAQAVRAASSLPGDAARRGRWTIRRSGRRFRPEEVRRCRFTSAPRRRQPRPTAGNWRSASSSKRSRRSTATGSCSSRRPTTSCPQHGMRAVDAMRLIGEELVLDGIPMRNLATFVTTWMEPEAQRIIAENLHRNFIDHAEYPQTAEIEQRCIRMLADLFHAPGRDDRRAHAGLVGGDHARRAVAEVEVARAAREGGQGHDAPEPRLRRRRARRVGEVLPLLRRRAADHPAAARQVHDRPRGRRAPRRREHDRRRRRARHDVHRPRRRHPGHQRPARRLQRRARARRPAARRRAPAAASCGRSCTRTPSGTSGSSRCARSTSRATSSGSSTRASAG